MPVAGLYEDTHNKIRARFDDQVVGDGTEISQAVYDNERQAPPQDQIWCECNVIDEDTQLAAYGGTQTFRKRGQMRAELYGPLGQGEATLLRAADSIRSAFNRVIADGVHYGAVSLGNIERREQFYAISCATPFYRDDRMARPDNAGSWSLLDREAAFNSIRSRFDRFFGASGSEDPHTVVYGNAPTKPPSDAQWIHFSINTGMTEEIGAGANAWARTVGLATAMICTPLGQGNKTALALADGIAQQFRSAIDDGVVFETPYVITAGRRQQWWQTNVNIRFRLEEVLP